MQLTKPVTREDLTRQERLLIWIRRQRMTQAAIASGIGVGKVAIGRLLFSERAPSWRVQQLREYGIPEDLLPRAEDISPGVKPGSIRNTHMRA